MSAQEASNPGKEPVDSGSAATDGPSLTLAPKSKSPPAVTIKKEPGTSETSNGKVGDANPAEICVVIGGSDGGASGGGSRRAQTEGMFALGTPPPTKSTDSCIGSYVCGVCGKKYKYYNCFQTHVRAHRESESMVGDGLPPTHNSVLDETLDYIRDLEAIMSGS